MYSSSLLQYIPHPFLFPLSEWIANLLKSFTFTAVVTFRNFFISLFQCWIVLISRPWRRERAKSSCFVNGIGFLSLSFITFIRNTFPDLENVILYHISPHIFVHLPTVRIIHYRFLDHKKLDGVIYKKDDLMSFFQELWYVSLVVNNSVQNHITNQILQFLVCILQLVKCWLIVNKIVDY